MNLMTLAMLWGLSGQPADGGTALDPCSEAIPLNLKTALLDRYPKYRLPRSSDQLPEFAKPRRGCFAVATADFDGDGKSDFALLMPGVSSEDVILVAALRRDKGWDFYELPSWCGTALRCFVEATRPGTFVRSGSMDDALEKDEVKRITSKTFCISSGTVESTNVVYVFQRGRWLHVWTSS
jgi:hypothetical protein